DLKIVLIIDIEAGDFVIDNRPNPISYVSRSAFNPERMPENIEIKGLISRRKFVAPHDGSALIPLRRLRDEETVLINSVQSRLRCGDNADRRNTRIPLECVDRGFNRSDRTKWRGWF